MSNSKDRVTGRRDFLKLAGAGTVGAAAAVVTGGSKAEAAGAAEDDGKLYRETEHVKRVYELSRF